MNDNEPGATRHRSAGLVGIVVAVIGAVIGLLFPFTSSLAVESHSPASTTTSSSSTTTTTRPCTWGQWQVDGDNYRIIEPTPPWTWRYSVWVVKACKNSAGIEVDWEYREIVRAVPLPYGCNEARNIHMFPDVLTHTDPPMLTTAFTMICGDAAGGAPGWSGDEVPISG